MNLHGNSGVYQTKHIGYLVGYSEPTWYDTKGVSKIVSMAMVEKHLLVM